MQKSQTWRFGRCFSSSNGCQISGKFFFRLVPWILSSPDLFSWRWWETPVPQSLPTMVLGGNMTSGGRKQLFFCREKFKGWMIHPIISICAMVKSRCIGDGHPTFNSNPYNGYINPYYWVDDHPPLYGNNGSLDPSTYIWCCFMGFSLSHHPIIPKKKSLNPWCWNPFCLLPWEAWVIRFSDARPGLPPQ